ncbi:MAG: hypothetical protein H7836_17310, partial [Magnetococcus sp. YQC-3]
LKYLIKGNETFIFLKKSYITMLLKMGGTVKVGSDTLDATAANTPKTGLSIVNNITHSMFKEIRIKLGGTVINRAQDQYPFKVYMQLLTSAGRDMQEYYLPCAGWIKDTAGQMDATITEDNKEAKCLNAGLLRRRREFFGETDVVGEFVFKPHTGLCLADILIPPFIDVEVELTRHDNPYFYLKSSQSTNNFNLEILEAIYEVLRYQCNTPYVSSIEKMLLDHPINMNLTDGHINTITVPANIRNFTVENLFHGNVPKKIALAMVGVDAFNGDPQKNPYNFQHFNVSHVKLLKNGQEYPVPECRTDFTATPNRFLSTFHKMMVSLNADYNDHCAAITPKEYSNGHFFYSFFMLPDKEAGWEMHQIQTGPSQIRLEIIFASNLAKAIQLIVFYTSDSVLTIDHLRRVSVVHQ